ncbi:MAG: hypothetical protein V3W18_01415 [candidate division Zixibacteria bacterium]
MRVLTCLLIIGLIAGIVGFSPDTASAQCKSKKMVSGWNSFSGSYDACDSWMKKTMEFDVDEGGYGEFLAYGANTPLYEVYEIYFWDEGHNVDVDWYYCSNLNDHEISIELAGGPVNPLELGFHNPVLKVQYFASQPD